MNIALILAAFETLVAIGMDGADIIAKVRTALENKPNPTDADWDGLHKLEAAWQVIIDKRMQTT